MVSGSKQWLLVFAFLSGFAALLYEFIWLREIHLIFGVSSYALATVFSTFLLGLVVGNYLGGIIVDRFSSLRSIGRLYGVVELGIALFATVTLILLASIQPILSLFYSPDMNVILLTVLRFILSSVVLIIPSTLIGTTFPILMRLYVEQRHQIKEGVSLLYFINTLGGVFGVIASGFIFVRLFGMNATLGIGVLLNVAVGIAVLFFSNRYGGRSVLSNEQSNATESRSLKIAVLFGLFFVSGFTALAYEVVWGRLLVLYSYGTIYATSLLLGLFLLGIALGSLIYKKAFRNARIRDFMYLELGIGLSAMLGLWIYTRLPLDATTGFATPLGLLLLLSASIVLIPALLFGIIFPLLSDYVLQRSKHLGKTTGSLYAINTLGAIIGAIVAGFVFIPSFGLKGSIVVLSFISLGIAAVALFVQKGRYCLKGSLPLVITFVLLFVLASGIPSVFSVGEFREGVSLVHYNHGISATISVLEDRQGPVTYNRLYVDNQEVAADTPVLALDSKILAHLPLLLHEDPQETLTVGFGSGGTSYSMLQHDVARVVAVEIEREVFDARDHFESLNNGVAEDERFSIIFDDARSYLTLTEDRYDVISTDVTNLRYRSNANLYTKEYFELLRNRLDKDGIVVAWIPVSDVNEEDQQILMRTFQEVFPEMSVWYMYNKLTHFLIYVGSEEPLHIDYDRFTQRFNEPLVRADLDRVGVTEYNLLNALFLDSDAVAAYLADTEEIHSDNSPVLAFPDLAVSDASFTFGENLHAIYSRKVDPMPYIAGFSSDAQRELLLSELRYEQLFVAKHIIAGHDALLRGDRQTAAREYAMGIENADYLETIDV